MANPYDILAHDSISPCICSIIKQDVDFFPTARIAAYTICPFCGAAISVQPAFWPIKSWNDDTAA